MANPLTLYVPIRQDAQAQYAAYFIYTNFPGPDATAASFLDLVHYARVALIPGGTNTKADMTNPLAPVVTPAISAVLLMTEFDGDMNTYLNKFFENGSAIKTAFAGLAAIALNPPAGFDPTKPDSLTYPIFYKFITSNNLSKPEDNFSAYPWTIDNIKSAMGLS